MATPPTAPPVPERRPAASAALDAQVIQELRNFAADIGYSGFSTTATREIIRTTIPAKDLVRILVVAAQVGNSPERLTGRITNPSAGRAALALLSKYNIKARGTATEDLTLPRIATAVAPLYYQIRVAVKDQLQNQSFGLGVPVEMQSPSLACFSDVQGWNTKPWLIMFGRQIKPTGESDEAADLRTEMFREIAVHNRESDPFLDSENLRKDVTALVKAIYQ